MTAIKAHFDGRVFVPDEPVALKPGERVVVQAEAESVSEKEDTTDVSFLRKLDIHLDPKVLREIVEDPELSIENF